MAGRLVLITLTGGRDLAWQLCKKMVAAQTVKPDLWVIVDDCLPSLPMDIDFCPIAVIYPDKVWQPGQNSQARNMLAALEHVTQEDKVLIIEDDDYYSPGYVEWMAGALENVDLVGEANALYYNVANRTWKDCGNYRHASLCSTGFKGKALEKLINVCRKNNKFIDMVLWNLCRHHIRNCLYMTRHSVGIKGLPGRPGIGSGHGMRGKPDADLKHLGKFVTPEFLEIYRQQHKPA